MRLSTTIARFLLSARFSASRFSASRFSASHGPERDHGDDDRDELQQDAQPHQALRGVGRTAPHHVDKTKQQDERNRRDRNGKNELAQKRSHHGYITPHYGKRHRPSRR